MINWENKNQDLLPNDESKELPEMRDEWFDGEKEQSKLKFTKCRHTLELVSASEARCTRCGVGYLGMNVLDLVKASRSKNR